MVSHEMLLLTIFIIIFTANLAIFSIMTLGLLYTIITATCLYCTAKRTFKTTQPVKSIPMQSSSIEEDPPFEVVLKNEDNQSDEDEESIVQNRLL